MKSAIVATAFVVGCTCTARAQGQSQSTVPQAVAPLPPVVVKEVKPVYPAAALADGVSGTVTLECVVKADGTVGDVRVVVPVEPSLDEQAIKALREWRFKPGTKDGKPVDVLVTIEMSFTYRVRGPKLDSPEVFKVGDGVTTPRVVRETKPAYTPEAMRQRIQGALTIDCVVLPDGTVGDARISTTLHPELDREALKTARQWRFEPGLKDGKPVPVQVTITMAFTLK